MKVLYVIPFFYPATQFGGPVKHLWAQVREMVKRGIDVRVVTTHAGVQDAIAPDMWHTTDGVAVYYASTGLVGGIAPFYCPSIKKELRRSIQDVDIVHLKVSLTFLNYWAHKICLEYGRPYVYSPHGCLSPVALRTKAWAKKPFTYIFEKFVVRNADALIALHDKEIGYMQDFVHDENLPCTVIHNGIVLRKDRPKYRSRADVREKFGLPEDAIVILFMSRLHSIKGLDVLTEAFAKARKRNPKLYLLLAGDDQGGKKIVIEHASKNGVTDFIHFAGHVDGDFKRSLFEATDLFTLTS